MREGRTCHRCGGKYLHVWNCDDMDLWRQVYEQATGRDGEGAGLLCPECFQIAATELGVVLFWTATVNCWQQEHPDPHHCCSCEEAVVKNALEMVDEKSDAS